MVHFCAMRVTKHRRVLINFHRGRTICELGLLTELIPRLTITSVGRLVYHCAPRIGTGLRHLTSGSSILRNTTMGLTRMGLLTPVIRPHRSMIYLNVGCSTRTRRTKHFSDRTFNNRHPCAVCFSGHIGETATDNRDIPHCRNLMSDLSCRTRLKIVLTGSTGNMDGRGTESCVFNCAVVGSVDTHGLRAHRGR